MRCRHGTTPYPMETSQTGPSEQTGLFLVELLNRAFPRAEYLLMFADVLEANTSQHLATITADVAAFTYVERLKRLGSLNLFNATAIAGFVHKVYFHAKTLPWNEIRELAGRYDVVLGESEPVRPSEEFTVILEAPQLSLSEQHAFMSAISSATGHTYQVERYRVIKHRLHLALRSTPAGKVALQRIGRARLTQLTGRPVWQIVHGGSTLALLAYGCVGRFTHNAAAGVLIVTLGATSAALVVEQAKDDASQSDDDTSKTVEDLRAELDGRNRNSAALEKALREAQATILELREGQDRMCPDGSTWREGQGCARLCLDSEVWRAGQGCVRACSDGTIWNANQGCVDACGPGTKWRPEVGCLGVCGPGLQWDDENGCVSVCAEGETWSAEAKCSKPSPGPSRTPPATPCEIPITWINVTAGYKEDYSCRLPAGARVRAIFEGTPEITSTIDNKIWNASIDMSLQPKSVACDSSDCKDSHGVPFGTASNQWSKFRMVGEAVVPKTGISTWDLMLGLCQTGPHQGSCSLQNGATLRIEIIP